MVWTMRCRPGVTLELEGREEWQDAIREVLHAIVVRRTCGIWRAVPNEEVEGRAGE
jgi:hypothetical protein